MFSCEYFNMSNDTCFEEHLGTAASENNNKKRFIKKSLVANGKCGQAKAKDWW